VTDTGPHQTAPNEDAVHAAKPSIEHKRRLSPIWIIPIVAAMVALYLGWVTLSQKGPTITIAFRTADGLEAGKTLIKHKAVVFGTVKTIALSEDMTHVEVTAEMTREAARLLHQNTHFWVVRPRLSASSGLSGLSTIVSGVYIDFDPGEGASQLNFTGLEEPPVIRADVPGTEFILKADQIGSIGPGSPIYFRDVEVGQILGFDSSNLSAGVTIRAFVRAPFDAQVYGGTHFWNASGISIETGTQGFKIQLESLQAVLAGGVAFDTPDNAHFGRSAKAGSSFELFKDHASVEEAQYTIRLPYLVYFDGSVGGLSPGASVEWHGMKVGRVSDVHLEYDVSKNAIRAPVVIELEPERIQLVGEDKNFGTGNLVGELVRRGLRAQVKTGNLITGQAIVSLDIDPKAAPAELGTGERYPVIPSVPNQFENLLNSINGILDRIAKLPLDKLIDQADSTLKSFQTVAAAPEIKDSLRSLSGALTSAETFLDNANTNLSPAMAKISPFIVAAEQAVKRINGTVGSIDQGYGNNSSFKRDLTKLMAQVEDATRSLRVLSDYLEQHPEALIRGKKE
jgi:paraquat-inducible protein B